tara:strand:+ start:12604 stop:13356 length:753 start_codon:yes stop_codon:yes gene_type:complete
MASKKEVKKCYGLLGRNIDYSFSRGYFIQKFKKEKLTHCRYQNFDLDSIDSVKSILEMDNISGLNVTTPYKREIIPYLDKISEQSKKIQAVNTIQFGRNGKKIGHNTDIFGFERSLLEITSKLPKNALILGTGGASSAVAFVLEKHKINYIYVSRNPSLNQINYNNLTPRLLKKHKLIINASPVGTFPRINLCPEIPYDAIDETHILFDLIYNPLETLFLNEGKKRGATISNGLKMLEYQAEKSWEIWNK